MVLRSSWYCSGLAEPSAATTLSDQRLKSARSSSGTPRSWAMTMVGRG